MRKNMRWREWSSFDPACRRT